MLIKTYWRTWEGADREYIVQDISEFACLSFYISNIGFNLFGQWENSDEDRVGLIGLGFAAIVALWTSTNVISVI